MASKCFLLLAHFTHLFLLCLTLPQMAWLGFFPWLICPIREWNSRQLSCTYLRDLNSGYFTDWPTAAGAGLLMIIQWAINALLLLNNVSSPFWKVNFLGLVRHSFNLSLARMVCLQRQNGCCVIQYWIWIFSSDQLGLTKASRYPTNRRFSQKYWPRYQLLVIVHKFCFHTQSSLQDKFYFGLKTLEEKELNFRSALFLANIG